MATVVSKKKYDKLQQEHDILLKEYEFKSRQVEYFRAKIKIIEFEHYEKERNQLPF